MKKLILFLCLIFILPLSACGQGEIIVDNNHTIENFVPNPPILPDNSEQEDDFEDDDDEQVVDGFTKKTKKYLVSTANSLRVRSKPSSSSTTLGYLDKNDALLIKGQTGEYYITVFKENTAYVHTSMCKVLEIECENDVVERAMDIGSSLLGYPYIWGAQRYHWGNGKLNSNFKKGEFDCSALTLYAFYMADGIILDVTTRTQVKNGVEVDINDLRRGDLMFFTNASRKNNVGVERIGHVAVYFGNNYILHTASDHAVIEPISDLRWGYYITSRRVA